MFSYVRVIFLLHYTFDFLVDLKKYSLGLSQGLVVAQESKNKFIQKISITVSWYDWGRLPVRCAMCNLVCGNNALLQK